MMPSVSCVVPLYNQLDCSRAMLGSLLETLPQSLDWEIILVDDASTDGTATWLSSLSDPRIKIVRNAHNVGYAATVNAGVRAASGDVLALLNNDLLFTAGWLEPMLDALNTTGLRAGLVGNLQYRVDDGALDHAGVCMTLSGQLEHVREEPDSWASCTRVLAATGACMVLRRGDFVAAGCFDEGYVNGSEDIDLCFRIRRRGLHIYVACSSRIRHHVSASRGQIRDREERNSRRLYRAWRSELKEALSACWLALLQSGATDFQRWIASHLEPEFVAHPQIAARIIAEALLLRQEARWQRLLDHRNPGRDAVEAVVLRGFDQMTSLAPAAPAHRVVMVPVGPTLCDSVRLLGACDEFPPGLTVTLRLKVNGIQYQCCQLIAGRAFSVSIDVPLWLRGAPNQLEVDLDCRDREGNRGRLPHGAVTFTQLLLGGVDTVFI